MAGKSHVSSAIRVNDHAIAQTQILVLSAAGLTGVNLAHGTASAQIADCVLVL